MADFLTRLASRALGLAPVVEPVVGSLFAPEPTAATAVGLDVALDDLRRLPELANGQDAPRPPSAPLSESAYRPVAEPRPPEVVPAASMQAPKVSGSYRRAAPAEPNESVVSAPAVARSQRATAGGMAAEVAFSLPPSVPSRQAPPVGSSPWVAATASVRPGYSDRVAGPTVWPSEEPAGAPERSGTRPRSEASASWNETADAPLLMPPVPAEPLPPSRRDAPTRRDEHGQAAASVSSPAPSPTIEITIGRVEVRAVHPPAPAARPKPASPPAARVSLEAYLRNQNGSGR